jgi:hypothetical protein
MFSPDKAEQIAKHMKALLTAKPKLTPSRRKRPSERRQRAWNRRSREIERAHLLL